MSVTSINEENNSSGKYIAYTSAGNTLERQRVNAVTMYHKNFNNICMNFKCVYLYM